MRKATSLLILGALAAASSWAQVGCPANIFDPTKGNYHCPLEDAATSLRLQIRFAGDYFELLQKVNADDPDELDPNGEKLKALRSKAGLIGAEVSPIGDDLSPLRIVPGSDRVVIGKTNITVEVPLAELTKTSSSISLVLPPGSLICDGLPVAEEVLVTLPSSTEGQSITDCTEQQNDATRPWDWKLDLAPAGEDANNGSGATFDFDAEKVWGYNMKIDEETRSWSTAVWRLKFDASGASNEIDFHDALKADFSWSWNKNYLGSGIARKPFTAFWLGAYVRPEATFDVDDVDYVYGARAEFLLNTRTLFGLKVPGTWPYLAFGYESVDPDKRQDGTVPDNYYRATGDFYWKAKPIKGVIFEATWEAKYILDRADATRLGLDGRLQDRLDLTISLLIPGNEEFLPFIRYTEGETGPLFTVAEEVLVGFTWDRLFPGEKAP